MHKFVSFNQNILAAEDTNISAISSASLYGKGIFTTLSIHHGKPFLWEKHWRRLADNAEKLDIILPDKAIFEAEMFKIINANKISTGRMRVSVFDESLTKIWSSNLLPKTSILITTGNLRTISDVKLSVSPYAIHSTSPLANIKSCNYLEQVLALEDANKNGFDEAIRLNERGEIVSACMANIFWVQDLKLYTPSLKTGCLAGITRELIIENFEVFETEQSFACSELQEIFLTSSGIGVVSAYLGSRNEKAEESKLLQDLITMLDFNRNLLT
jgi:branched-subunit amino acid aminotransferase/4-amino-4-deoxychorismate lyase